MKINSIKEDNDQISRGVKPQYLVVSEQVGCPFVSAEMAIQWHSYMLQQGVKTVIWDLTDYDWETNPANFKTHDLSTAEGMEAIGQDLALRNQTTIN